MVWLNRSPIPVGRRGVISSFKWFPPAFPRVEEGVRGSAPYGTTKRYIFWLDEKTMILLERRGVISHGNSISRGSKCISHGNKCISHGSKCISHGSKCIPHVYIATSSWRLNQRGAGKRHVKEETGRITTVVGFTYLTKVGGERSTNRKPKNKRF